MTSPKTASERAATGDDIHPADLQHDDPDGAKLAAARERREARRAGTLKHLGGSHSDPVNIRIANDAKEATWMPSQEERDRAVEEIGDMMAGINPRDVLEGMLASQLVAANAAAMECYRRAMIPTNTIPGREMNLNQANKASRTFTALLETLNRHRNKGQQRVVVEHVHRHVHVHEGSAPLASSETRGDRVELESTSQPHAQKALGYALEPALRSEDAPREPVLRSGDGEREVPHARGN